MPLIDYAKAIKETGRQLLEKERQQHKAYLRDRMRFLRLLKSRQCLSQKQAGELIGLSQRSSQRLWKQYCEGGCKALLTYPYQGRPCRLSNEQRKQLNNYLRISQFLHEAMCRSFDSEIQAFFIIDAVHAFMIILESFSMKQNINTPQAISNTCRCNLLNTLP